MQERVLTIAFTAKDPTSSPGEVVGPWDGDLLTLRLPSVVLWGANGVDPPGRIHKISKWKRDKNNVEYKEGLLHGDVIDGHGSLRGEDILSLEKG